MTAAGMLGKAVTMEIGIWRALYRWVTRRPRASGTDAHGFSYAKPLLPVLWAFAAMSAVDIPVLHLVLPWPAVRAVVLVLGIWGLAWMLGFLASVVVYPHVVSEEGLRIRHGMSVDLMVRWDTMTGIATRRRTLPSSRTVQLTDDGDSTALHVGVSGQTNVRVTLRHPVTVPLPKGPRAVTEVNFYADDPAALVATARGDEVTAAGTR